MGHLISSIRSLSEAMLQKIAGKLSPLFKSGDIIALSGNLGVGKSTFARAFIRESLSNPDEEVPSPTFTLAQQYIPDDAQKPEIWHFDFYRLENPKDAIELGIEDAFNEGVCLIEWPQKIDTLLPQDCLIIKIKSGKGEDTRFLEFYGNDLWETRLKSKLTDPLLLA